MVELFIAALLCFTHSSPWNPTANLPPSARPVAPASSQVRCDAFTRFSVIEDRLVRAEYSASGDFEDRATIAVVNRVTAGATAPTFTVANGSAWCNITVKPSGVVVSYRHGSLASLGSTPFVRHQLSASAGSGILWHAGDDARVANLGGTLIALSGVDGEMPLDCTGKTDPHSGSGIKVGMGWVCTLGVASRAGWAILNDTFNAVIDPATQWIEPSAALASGDRSGGTSGADASASADLYLFLYGSDYRGASAALSSLSGAQPIPPRHAFGVASSRYEQFSAGEVRSQVTEGFEEHGVPLDVLNLDTGWHTQFCFLETPKGCLSVPNPGGGASPKGYGGLFEWDQTLFPSIPATLNGTPMEQPIVKWLKARNLTSYLDVHHCPGILNENTNYPSVAAAMGLTPAEIAKGESIPIDVTNRTFIAEYFNTLLEQQVGSDVYYWIDYCMGPAGYTSKAWCVCKLCCCLYLEVHDVPMPQRPSLTLALQTTVTIFHANASHNLTPSP